MPTHPDAVEAYVIEDYVLESSEYTGDRVLLVAVPRERRLIDVRGESRVFTIPRESRLVAVPGVDR